MVASCDQLSDASALIDDPVLCVRTYIVDSMYCLWRNKIDDDDVECLQYCARYKE
jgi:hypothetical protein